MSRSGVTAPVESKPTIRLGFTPPNDGGGPTGLGVGSGEVFVGMLKSKSTPIRSKKSSCNVMNRTSIVTCKSCKRRSCCNKSAICS